MMKKTAALTALGLAMFVAFTGCSGKREPGRIYMPDMAYSRAYEAYAGKDSAKFTINESDRGGMRIYFDGKPAAGTIKRGELFPYTLLNDSNGYKMSAMVKDPLENPSEADMKEAKRLFNINCAICHGDKGTGNGPIADKIGAVANLTLPLYVGMADGTMFHSITYGKNNMGSYASQLDREQRWMIVKYIRTLQPKAAMDTAAKTPVPVAVDSAATVKK